MTRPNDLDQWTPGSLQRPAKILEVDASRLVSLKLRPVRYDSGYSRWMTAHMPREFYEDWRESLHALPLKKEVELNVRGYRNGTRFWTEDTQILVAEHESGPEIIMWFMQHPEAATAGLTAIAAGLGAIGGAIGIVKEGVGVLGTGLGVLKSWLDLQRVLVGRIEKANDQAKRGDTTSFGYQADGLSMELRTDSEAKLLGMTPFPIIDTSQLDRFQEEAISNLMAGKEWTGELPPPP